MSQQLKNILVIIFSVGISGATAWLVRAAYDKRDYTLPLILLAAFSLLQIGLTFFRSNEEKELQLYRELGLSKVRQKIRESETLSNRIQREFESGDLKTARECMDIRELL
jgi:hypothetical protein